MVAEQSKKGKVAGVPCSTTRRPAGIRISSWKMYGVVGASIPPAAGCRWMTAQAAAGPLLSLRPCLL